MRDGITAAAPREHVHIMQHQLAKFVKDGHLNKSRKTKRNFLEMAYMHQETWRIYKKPYIKKFSETIATTTTTTNTYTNTTTYTTANTTRVHYKGLWCKT